MENATIKTQIKNFEIEIEYQYKYGEWNDDKFTGASLDVLCYKIDGKTATDFIAEVFDFEFTENLEQDLADWQFLPLYNGGRKFY